ncbi:MAG: energy-coupled thiamine transporter ThiT [Defluviitaleaceae bacterium]|nr:energy-coupled thiamine transporter ThiT [Defluviitaleaceae bacterium]
MEQFQDFLNSGLGSGLAIVIAAAIFLAMTGLFFKKAKFNLRAMVYAALALSIAFVLSYFRLFPMPQGGSVTPLSMFFVSIIGIWFGPGVGLVSGVTYGFLRIVQGAWIIHPMQFLLDYPLAFGMLGLAGFFWKHKHGMYIGFVVAVVGRFIMSTLAGWIYWIGIDTPGSLWMSMSYNGPFMFAEMAISLAIIVLPPVRHALNHVKRYITISSAKQGG